MTAACAIPVWCRQASRRVFVAQFNPSRRPPAESSLKKCIVGGDPNFPPTVSRCGATALDCGSHRRHSGSGASATSAEGLPVRSTQTGGGATLLRRPARLLLVVICLCLPASAESIAEPPLLAQWSCDDGSGTVLSDSSGNGNHGAISGAMFVPQGSGYALSLDGRDDYVDCGESQAIGIGGPLSIEAWIKPTRKAHGQSCVFGQSMSGYLLTFYAGDLMWYIGHGGATTSYVGRGRVEVGEWHHVVATFDGDVLKVWMNGRLTRRGDPQPPEHTRQIRLRRRG